ncbi:MAG: ATP-binding protein [Deltaproteobacteria bacterium]|jgi:signal transduction histidine kinase|nr:ATP-binding protein [Deltaproteobacteria bacterium]
MIERIRKALGPIWPEFFHQDIKLLDPYMTFTDYRKIWTLGISVLIATALVPLLVVTIIHYRLLDKSVDSELRLRTERLASNAKRAITFFLEERLDALRFTVNEISYDRLTDPDHLEEILRNLKLGFGGLTDLSVIDRTGKQLAYAGPYNLEGRDYSNQRWFIECQQHNFYVSEIFRGYRDVPHIIIAAKSLREDGSFFFIRATLDTERLIRALQSYETGAHAHIFLVNRSGVIQTPAKQHGDIFQKMSLPVPVFSERTRVSIAKDDKGKTLIVGYAYIFTQIADTPFILMVIKHKAGMMQVWHQLRSNINWFVGSGAFVILAVIIITCTLLVNKLFHADKAKAEAMALMEQSNQLASIGQLAAGVAHEINNPLALINETAGYVKDLFVLKERYGHDDELIGYIDDILDAVERCGMITSQLLGFARKFEVKIQEVNLKEAISDVLVFHNKEASYRNIKVCVDVPEDMPPIKTDRAKLQQVLVNLVNNAFQALDDGCRLDIEASPAGNNKIRIAVSDNGCGIPEENLPKIFEPFFTTKKGSRGTGLGLAITYGLVKKLHGEITLKSKLDEGTTFTITLPTQIQEGSIENEGATGR